MHKIITEHMECERLNGGINMVHGYPWGSLDHDSGCSFPWRGPVRPEQKRGICVTHIIGDMFVWHRNQSPLSILLIWVALWKEQFRGEQRTMKKQTGCHAPNLRGHARSWLIARGGLFLSPPGLWVAKEKWWWTHGHFPYQGGLVWGKQR